MISLLPPHVAKFTSSSLSLTVARHLRQKNYSAVLTTCYIPKEKTRCANPKLDLVEEVALKTPTRRESTKDLKHKGNKWAQPAQCFPPALKQQIALMGVFTDLLDQSQLHFLGPWLMTGKEAESTHVVLESTTKFLLEKKNHWGNKTKWCVCGWFDWTVSRGMELVYKSKICICTIVNCFSSVGSTFWQKLS